MLDSEPKAAQVSVTALSVYRGKQTECWAYLGLSQLCVLAGPITEKLIYPKNNQPTRFGGCNTNLTDTEGSASCCTKDLECKTTNLTSAKDEDSQQVTSTSCPIPRHTLHVCTCHQCESVADACVFI